MRKELLIIGGALWFATPGYKGEVQPPTEGDTDTGTDSDRRADRPTQVLVRLRPRRLNA